MSPRTSSSGDEPVEEQSAPTEEASDDAELPETDFEKAQAEEVHRAEDPEYAAKKDAEEAEAAAKAAEDS